MATWYCNDVDLPYIDGWRNTDYAGAEPYLLWQCKDDALPYKQGWKEIPEVVEPCPALTWVCNDKRLPYKPMWRKIEFFTTLNFPLLDYEIQLVTGLDYEIQTPAEAVNLTTRVFEDENKVYAYKGLNKQITIDTTNNTTIIWLNKMFAFNDSSVTVKLGQFKHGEQEKIQLFLSDVIPEEWGLEHFYDQNLVMPYSETSFNVTENITRYMGIGFAHATVGIISVYIDDMRVI